MRCPAQYKTACGIQCGLPKGHKYSHLKSDGAVGKSWEDSESYWPTEEVPVFRIKASDPFACAIIQVWIVCARAYKRMVDGKEIRIPDEKINGACDRVREFRRWQNEHGTKVPD